MEEKEKNMQDFLKKILWATDLSAEAKQALLYAKLLAKKFNSNLIAVHIVPDFPSVIYDTSLFVKADLLKRLESVKEETYSKIKALGKAEGIVFNKIIVKEGSVPKEILEISEKEKADLIVIGKKGLSALEKIFIGNVANQLLRHSFIPVLLTKKRKRKIQVKKILVPTDFSSREEIERDFAWKLAKGFDASLTFLHVLELYHKFSPKELDEMFRSLLVRLKKRKKKEHEDIKVSEDIIRAINAPTGIVDYAQTNNFDLIVISSLVKKLERFFLGSTTEKVISYTDIPVFAIPSSKD